MSHKASLPCISAFAAATLAGIGPALAAVTVGLRLSPVALTVDDPGVDDELSLPSFTYMTNPDGSVQYDFSGEWQKRITPDFSISIGDTFTHLNNPRANGWQNFETTFRYELFTNAEHEFILTLGVGFEWGHTGNASVGAEPFTRWRPEIWFGKGFGDLPTSLNFLRPFAVTGNLGVSFPTGAIVVNGVTQDQFGNNIVSVTNNPTFFNWGLSLQYSLIYMNSNVLELQPGFLRYLVPLVEVNFSTPIANTGPSVTGTSPPARSTLESFT